MRERAYVAVARLSGMSGTRSHLAGDDAEPPALLAASFVSAVSSAILASIGLEALGLGPQNEPTLA